MNAQLNPQSPATSAVRFVKIDAAGQHLAANGIGHAAVLDTSTNLTHAVGVCPRRLSEEETDALIARMNADRYAGFDNWRVPTVKEDFGITDHTRYSPAADTDFFPDMKSDWYRTATPTPWSSDYVFCVYFNRRLVNYLYRNLEAFVRPVRSVSPGQ